MGIGVLPLAYIQYGGKHFYCSFLYVPGGSGNSTSEYHQVPKVGGEIQIQMFVSGAGQFWWHLGFGDLIIGFVCGT